MKPLYLKIIVLIVTNPQWVGDSSMSLLPSVDMPIKKIGFTIAEEKIFFDQGILILP